MPISPRLGIMIDRGRLRGIVMLRLCRAEVRALLVCALVCLLATPAWAQRRSGGGQTSGTVGRNFVPGAQQANIHNPYSPGYVDMQPRGLERRSAGGSPDFGGQHQGGGHQGGGNGHSHQHGGNNSPIFIPYPVPSYGYGYGGSGYGGYGYDGYGYGPRVGPYGYGYGYGGYSYGGWLPPIVLPAETLYGPQAVKRFLGLDDPPVPVVFNANVPAIAPAAMLPGVGAPGFGVPAAGNAAQGGFGQLAPGNFDPPLRNKIRASNAETRARSRKYITFGDEHFSKQRYADANQRYRQAADAAPDLGEGFFRQAFALAALGRYDTAVKAVKRGLEVTPDWPRTGFRLDVLYVDNQLAKTAHFEAMAKAAAADANNADLLYLLGVYLHFDGHAGRARPFFLRARDLGFDEAYLAGFLKALPAPPAAAPAKVAGVEI